MRGSYGRRTAINGHGRMCGHHHSRQRFGTTTGLRHIRPYGLCRKAGENGKSRKGTCRHVLKGAVCRSVLQSSASDIKRITIQEKSSIIFTKHLLYFNHLKTKILRTEIPPHFTSFRKHLCINTIHLKHIIYSTNTPHPPWVVFAFSVPLACV